jgi:hypothetical protein
MEVGLALDVVSHDLGHSGLGRPIDVEDPSLAAALDRRQHGPLVACAARAIPVKPAGALRDTGQNDGHGLDDGEVFLRALALIRPTKFCFREREHANEYCAASRL